MKTTAPGGAPALASLVFFASTAAALAAPSACERLLLADPDVARQPLTELVRPGKPWLHLEANSEQRQPLQLGATPRELALGLARPERPRLYESLKDLATRQAETIRKRLGGGELELEAWPIQNDRGQLTWAFARWRTAGAEDWTWLDADELGISDARAESPVLPVTKKTWLKADRAALFTDVLGQDGLYDKPLFGDAVWTDESGRDVVGGWLPTDKMADERARFERRRLLAHVIAQPPHFNERPLSFILRASARGVELPGDIDWIKPLDTARLPSPRSPGEASVAKWPDTYESSYEADVRALSGADEVVMPETGKRVRFERKNSIDPNNQLEELVDYLSARYRALGIKTVRQRFMWHGQRQSNLVAIIPGSLEGAANRPILMADHIDTAFSEDAFEKTGRRVSAPGADDNVTATAALLRAAELLKDSHPKHDIWLVHLTGEEFPADDLGARKLIGRLLADKRDLGGLVLMDMIGYRKHDDRVFQINAADDPRSLEIAAEARDAAKSLAAAYEPALRTRFDKHSYLYNTDGIVFADAGYPVILLNEHINALENLNRPHYHATTDTIEHVDVAYASAISKVAIETVARLSKRR